MIFPQAQGVGYDVIGRLMQGDAALKLVLGILIVKWLIWSVALGSGTSGGALAPVMMIGAALGGLLSYGMPNMGPGFWAIIGVEAMLSGALRVPITAIIFTVEQTHDWNMLLPLLAACVAAYGVSVLLLERSILTEKVARRGYHLSNEYAIDPLELLYTREVMRTNIVVLQGSSRLSEAERMLQNELHNARRLLPVVDGQGVLQGVVMRGELHRLRRESDANGDLPVREIAKVVTADVYADDPLRVAVYRMAEKGVTRMPVVARETRQWLGMISLEDLLKARTRHLEQEWRREQILRWSDLAPGSRTPDAPADAA